MFLRVAVLMSPRLYGHVGREFKVRPFSAGSILTLRNRIEPLSRRVGTLTQPLPEGEEKSRSRFCTDRTPRKMQSKKLTLSIHLIGITVLVVFNL